MGSFSVRYEAVVFKFVGILYRQGNNGLDRSIITIPCHTLNSPISCGERHGSQNGRVSEVPDVYEVCPLKPCKGGIRQRISNRPARYLHGESKINTPPHTHSVKAFEGVTTRQSRVGRICQRQISPQERECRFATSPNWRIAPILFSKSSLWRVQGRALPSFAPRYLHPDKPQFEASAEPHPGSFALSP